MSLHMHWFLPTSGDGRHVVETGRLGVGTARGSRPPTLSYLTQITRAAEELGFEAALTPTGTWCEDAWVTTAMLTQTTERLKFLVAFRPGVTAPKLAAQMAATFQWHSRGRLLLNVVTGGDEAEQRSFGDDLGKDARYERTGEFLDIVHRLWRGETVDVEGRHLHVHDAALDRLPDPVPDVFFGGSSPTALDVAARHVDVYLTWGEPPDAAAAKLDEVRRRAAAGGRTVRFGIRLHVVSRDRAEDAWLAAERLLDGVDPATIDAVQARLRESTSEGQRRMVALHDGNGLDAGGRRDVGRGLEVAPNLWTGVGLARGGAGTALVGSHTEVADRIAEYAAIGIDHFVLSGYPCLEELYWFGEGVLPVLRDRGLWSPPSEVSLPAVAGEGAVARIPFAGARAVRAASS